MPQIIQEITMNKTFALGGAAAVALTSLLAIAPASAFTFHPATPAEMKQTDDLNAQALQNAQGSAGTSQASFSNAPTSNNSDMAAPSSKPMKKMPKSTNTDGSMNGNMNGDGSTATPPTPAPTNDGTMAPAPATPAPGSTEAPAPTTPGSTQ
jgi:hypothetical protein